MEIIDSKRKTWDRKCDEELLECISKHGPRKWKVIATKIEDRTGKMCRERWLNQLNPLLKKGNWTIEENWIIFIMK